MRTMISLVQDMCVHEYFYRLIVHILAYSLGDLNVLYNRRSMIPGT